MNDPEQPDTELERRYRRLLRLFPAHYRRDWGQELLAVLMQNAKPGQRRPEPAEAAALLWQAGKVWCHTAVSADRNANHRAAAILTVALPLLLLFPAAKAVAEFMLFPSSSMWRQHFDLITWALWIPAAAASVVGPRNVARWIAGLAVLAYLVFLLRPVLNGDTGTISTSFGWLLIQVTACRLLTSGRRVALGRRLLWRGRKALAGSAVLIFVVLAAPVLLEATPGLTRPFFATMTLAVIAAAVLGLRTPVGRVLVTAGGALLAGLVAGHGWWTGIGDTGLLMPTTDHPNAGSMMWLLLLPVLVLIAARLSGAALARTTTK